MLGKIKEMAEWYVRSKGLHTGIRVFFSGEELVGESGEYDVLLLDLMLPGMDGVEVARRFGFISLFRSAFIRFYEGLVLFFYYVYFEIVKVDRIYKVILIKAYFAVPFEFCYCGIKPNRFAQIKFITDCF